MQRGFAQQSATATIVRHPCKPDLRLFNEPSRFKTIFRNHDTPLNRAIASIAATVPAIKGLFSHHR